MIFVKLNQRKGLKMKTEPQEIYIQTVEFFMDDIQDEYTLDEFVEKIKNHFDFSNPDYKHKIVPYITMRDGGDYSPDYEETMNLDLITYRMETEEEANLRVEKYNREQQERLEKEEIKREAQSKQYKEQCKKQSKEKLKEWYDKATEYYTKEEVEQILKG